MPSASIVCGALLILLGIIGYLLSLLDGKASWTALIPAAFGLLLLVFVFLAKSKESLRMHLMHAAVLVGLVGFIVPAYRILSKLGDVRIASPAFLTQLAMALICLAFVVLS